MTIRFDEALDAYVDIVRQCLQSDLRDTGKVVIIRDLIGRLRLAVERQPSGDLVELEKRLREATGRFYGEGVLVGTDMLAPESIFNSADSYDLHGIALLERVAVGADWTRPALPNKYPRPPRATLYGVKGGVGRSTALCAWARHLATIGSRVLVVDLDLESPGVSATLLHPDALPDFGIVDWLVEDAVRNADEELSRSIVGRSPLASGTRGEILVAPCAGPISDRYVAKLARAYLDVPSDEGGTHSFAERVATMMDELERVWEPTVVLIDSRAGLHDLAAIAVTRLSAMSFLFGVNSRQTWHGYRTLLRAWMRRSSIAIDVRERVRVVAAQVPETGREQYLDQFITSSYDLFADSFYEEVSREHPDGFNFDVTARDAPHYPLPIYWSRPFQDWDPLSSEISEDQIRSAFGSFLDGATDLVLDPEAPDGIKQ